MATSSITKEFFIDDPKEFDRLLEIDRLEAVPLEIDRELLERGRIALSTLQFH